MMHKSYAFETRTEVLRELQSLFETEARKQNKKLVGARKLDGSPIDGDVDEVSFLFGEHLKFTANINPKYLQENHPAPNGEFFLEVNVEKLPNVSEDDYLANIHHFMESVIQQNDNL